MDEVYCFGCGVDLTAKSAERRKLTEDSETSQRVKQAWKKLVADKFADAADNDIERLASGAKLCRKCFLAFDCPYSFNRFSTAAMALSMLRSHISIFTRVNIIQ